MSKAARVELLAVRARRDATGVQIAPAVRATSVGAANDNLPAPAGPAEYPIGGERDVPLLELRVVGDGRAFIRALARAIVRRELISAGLIAAPDPCASPRRAGRFRPPGGVESRP